MRCLRLQVKLCFVVGSDPSQYTGAKFVATSVFCLITYACHPSNSLTSWHVFIQGERLTVSRSRGRRAVSHLVLKVSSISKGFSQNGSPSSKNQGGQASPARLPKRCCGSFPHRAKLKLAQDGDASASHTEDSPCAWQARQGARRKGWRSRL